MSSVVAAIIAMVAAPAPKNIVTAFSSASLLSYKSPSLCQRHTFTPCLHATTSDDGTSTSTSTSTFESLGLSDDLVTVAQKMNWQIPTPVQQLSIPAILDMAGYNDYDGGQSSSLWCEGPTGR